jgi:His/Glu/Gln/Arg/opine family amino acid ABC transporter permease subunit
MTLDPTLFIRYAPLLFQGAWVTVKITVMAFVFGYAAGVVIALLSLLPGRLPRAIITSYKTLLRGVPFIILLFLVYYGLPFAGIRLPAFVVGTVALAVFNSDYYAEVVRSAIVALPRGQFDSARAVGMSASQTMRHVVGPQVLRSLLPPSTNVTLTMIKESSVLSSITVAELTYQGLVMQGETYAPIESFAAVTGIYWAISASVAFAADRLERRVGRAQTERIGRSSLATSYLSFDR